MHCEGEACSLLHGMYFEVSSRGVQIHAITEYAGTLECRATASIEYIIEFWYGGKMSQCKTETPQSKAHDISLAMKPTAPLAIMLFAENVNRQHY